MAIPSTESFLTRFPEFGEQSEDIVEGAIAEAGRAASPVVWGPLHTDGVTYLAAHLLATRIAQIGLQIEARSGAPTGNLIESTLYGQEYKRLLDSLAICGFSL